MQQRTTGTRLNPPNKSSAYQGNTTGSGQTRTAGSQINRVSGAQAAGARTHGDGTRNEHTIVCRKCKSPQIAANKRGYSFVNFFKTLGWMALLPLLIIILGTVVLNAIMWKTDLRINDDLIGVIGLICYFSLSLSLPVSFFVGFVGRGEIVNGCMNCGFKWTPGKRK
ncbi:hypothetical protein [Paenibacillus apiarius]|uniref:hypothetical protein n=1 Tax=Paenibacillus apiarius TaxID=46240 RepID=UPI003B3B92A6